MHGLFTQRIKGKPVGGFERLQIGEIHLRRHPQQRALNIHLDRCAQLGVRDMPGNRFSGLRSRLGRRVLGGLAPNTEREKYAGQDEQIVVLVDAHRMMIVVF